uniref:hypothetical protein n=1 Tax=Cephaloticoccus sp. TaxID=1985742 RepID=UPI00404AE2CA
LTSKVAQNSEVRSALIGIHVILQLVHFEVVKIPWYVRQIFDVDEEDSFPTWYSASALLLASVTLWINARRMQAKADSMRWHWQGLAMGFLVLSIDEIAGIHETLNSLGKTSWAIPGGIIATVVGLAYLKFLTRIDRKTAVQFVIGGAVFVGGAVGVELYTERYLVNDELNTLAYNLWNALEEGMEMAGVLIFLRALLYSMKAGVAVQPFDIDLVD